MIVLVAGGVMAAAGGGPDASSCTTDFGQRLALLLGVVSSTARPTFKGPRLRRLARPRLLLSLHPCRYLAHQRGVAKCLAYTGNDGKCTRDEGDAEEAGTYGWMRLPGTGLTFILGTVAYIGAGVRLAKYGVVALPVADCRVLPEMSRAVKR